eukprot:scaffold62654_cov65-Phaeocystis_antarctica.AAC.1
MRAPCVSARVRPMRGALCSARFRAPFAGQARVPRWGRLAAACRAPCASFVAGAPLPRGRRRGAAPPSSAPVSRRESRLPRLPAR